MSGLYNQQTGAWGLQYSQTPRGCPPGCAWAAPRRRPQQSAGAAIEQEIERSVTPSAPSVRNMLLTHQAGTFPRAAPQPAQRLRVRACASKPALASSLHRRTALSWLSLSTFAAGGAARAQEDSFEPAKKLSTEYTTLEKSYKEKDETTAGDVGRFAGATACCELNSIGEVYELSILSTDALWLSQRSAERSRWLWRS